MLHAFGNDEREAAENDGDVVMPSSVRTSLEVIEPQLAFQLFIDTLRAPTLLRDAYDLLLAEPMWQGREDELRRLILAFGPFHHEPYGLVRRRLDAVLTGDLDPPEAEARRQLTTTAGNSQ